MPKMTMTTLTILGLWQSKFRPESSRLALLSQRVKAILRKARAGFGLLSTFPLDTIHRKPA